jgi:hypothetical protein
MKLLPLVLALLLVACQSESKPPLPTSQDFEAWYQVMEAERVADAKDKTLWMYSAGSFALFAIGLGVIAFSPVRRFAGLVFVAGGVVGMASVWIFEADWFPWVAGGTVGLILLSALAFAWVKIYEEYLSPPSPPGKSR